MEERLKLLFEADSVGFEVGSSDFCGTVHSVFTKACNLLIRESASSRVCITTLLALSAGRSPQGIRLQVSSDFDFRRRFRVGDSFMCRDGMIRFDSRPSITIDLGGAYLWNRRLGSYNVDLANPSAAQTWIALRDAAFSCAMAKSVGAMPFLYPLIECAGPGTHRHGFLSRIAVRTHGLRAVLDRDAVSKTLAMRVAESVPAIVAAARGTDSRRTAAGFESLIGLGPGLTPAGDDFVVGFLAGLWCTKGDRSDRAEFLECLAMETAGLVSQTNDISATLLLSALQGNFCESLVDLAECLSSDSVGSGVPEADSLEPELTCAADRALRTGATSGVTGVAGLLLGQTVWKEL